MRNFAAMARQRSEREVPTLFSLDELSKTERKEDAA